MTVKLYVNWAEEKILTEAGYDKEKERLAADYMKCPDDELVDKWMGSLILDDYRNLLFSLTNENIRGSLLKNWQAFCEEEVEEQMYESYAEEEIEV